MFNVVRSSDKKIILIGMPGSGKSTLARALADRTGKSVVDCADEFSRRYGSINAFRTAHGEQKYREAEQDILIECARSDADIISCVGDAVLNKRVMNALRQAGDIVYLNAPVELLKARAGNSSRSLKGDIDCLYKTCKPLYERYADYTVDVSYDDVLQKTLAALSEARSNRYDVLLCDADDTVLDFQAAMRLAIVNLKKTFGLKRDDETLVTTFHKCTQEVFGRLERGEIDRATLGRLRFDMLCDMLGESLDGEQANSFFFQEIMKTRFVRQGALEFLSGLRSRGVKVFIVTNSFTHVAKQRLQVLDGYADGAFISQEVGFDKPNVKYFEIVHKEIGSPNKDRMLILGDSNTSDIAGGIAFGIDACFFDPSGQKPTSADFRARDYNQVDSLI